MYEKASSQAGAMKSDKPLSGEERKVPGTAALKLTVESNMVTCEAGEGTVTVRKWLAVIRMSLAGRSVDLETAVSGLSVACPLPDVTTACQGMVDAHTAVYEVAQVDRSGGALSSSVPLKITLTLRYHSATGNLYRLEPRLSALVGRRYLQQPKYALTAVLAYARNRGLLGANAVVCDGALRGALGCPWVTLRGLWKTLSASIRPMKETVLVTHSLGRGSSRSQTSLAVTVDRQLNIFPKDWSSLKRPQLSKVASFPVDNTKRNTLKRHKSA